jgi:hypothetical protein
LSYLCDGPTNGNIQRSPNSNPGIINRQSHATDAQNTILTIQLISMTGGIEDLANLTVWGVVPAIQLPLLVNVGHCVQYSTFQLAAQLRSKKKSW